MRQGKKWGYTTDVFMSQSVEVHVISGKLRIKMWMDKKLIDETVIGKGETSAVYAGFEHQFEGLEDTICLEIYHIFLEPGDINRRKGSVGGIKK